MAEEQDSLKAEMNEALRGDFERARERRVGSPVAQPEPEPTPEPEPAPEPEAKRGFFRRLLG